MKILNTIIALGVLLCANLGATEIKDEWGRKIANGDFDSFASDGGTDSTQTEVTQIVHHTCWVTFGFYVQTCDFIGTTTATEDGESSSDYLDQSEGGETPNFNGPVEVELVGNSTYHESYGYYYRTYTSEINSHHYVWAMDYISSGSGHWDDTPFISQGSTDLAPL